MGPQVDLGYQFKSVSNRYLDGAPPILFAYMMQSIDSKVFSLGFGAVLGINLNPGRLFTVSFEIGVTTSIGIGPYHKSEWGIMYLNMPPFSIGTAPILPENKSSDTAVGKAEGFARLSFIFRVGDTYVAEKPREIDIKLRE
ncbi:MAG: hypothetical protein A2W19_14845 [Spirochaetes bacterium RBG_16_49_21]|nr:MAG: hypothetical protein A2W19_14845 [Spirochaetes bacterium RBG_16_49_21]